MRSEQPWGVSHAGEIGINVGFFKFETEVTFTDKQREHWAQFLSVLEDYRVLFNPLNAEYAGEVYFAVLRLRDTALPEATKDLRADDLLRTSYSKLRNAIRHFLDSVRSIGQERLSDTSLRVYDLPYVVDQCMFVTALVE